ncbi:MAG: CpaF family protein [bacterium]
MSLLQRLEKAKGETDGVQEPGPREKPSSPEEKLKEEVHARIVSQVGSDLMRGRKADDQRDILRSKIEELVITVGSEEGITLSRAEHNAIVNDLINEILGFGPIEPLLDNPDVSEIMINAVDQVFVEKSGKLTKTDIVFKDKDHLMNIIQKIVAPLGRRVDESQPYCDARLPDGSRVNVIIPPLALEGPTVTIRKFAEDPLTVEDLIKFGSLSRQMADFLNGCVDAALNIIVSGGTGSGKTTTLNCLSSFIPSDDRIVTIEDSAELQLQQEHVVRLETRPPNIEGTGEVTMRDLVKNSLRMRPDRIIVGECRGGEALDMLQAMNTGHDGSLTTVHANNPREAISRLETLVMMAGMDLPQRAIREQISSAVDLVVQQSRLRDGSRKVISIAEIQGMEQDTVLLSEIFTFEQEGMVDNKIVGKLKPTGVRPSFFKRFKEEGIELPKDLFVESG